MFKPSFISAGLVLSVALAGSAFAGQAESGVIPSRIVTLTTTEGHTLTVEVDAYGGFKDARFAPPGFAEADTTFEAATYFGTEGRFVASSLVPGGTYKSLNVKQTKPFAAASGFALNKGLLRVNLLQSLKETTGGVTFFQTYTLTNKDTQPVTFSLVRYHDVDLEFSGSSSDDVAALLGSSKTPSAIDVDATAAKLKPLVYLSVSGGGQAQKAAVRRFSDLKDALTNQGTIPQEWQSAVGNDADGDGRADSGMDLATAAGTHVTLAAGQRTKVVVRTDFLLRNFR